MRRTGNPQDCATARRDADVVGGQGQCGDQRGQAGCARSSKQGVWTRGARCQRHTVWPGGLRGTRSHGRRPWGRRLPVRPAAAACRQQVVAYIAESDRAQPHECPSRPVKGVESDGDLLRSRGGPRWAPNLVNGTGTWTDRRAVYRGSPPSRRAAAHVVFPGAEALLGRRGLVVGGGAPGQPSRARPVVPTREGPRRRR